METVVSVLVVPEAEWKALLAGQMEMIRFLSEWRNDMAVAGPVNPYITAMEFMQAVRIGRTKFDQLVAANKVKTIKKDRKIYVPAGEVERYFEIEIPSKKRR